MKSSFQSRRPNTDTARSLVLVSCVALMVLIASGALPRAARVSGSGARAAGEAPASQPPGGDPACCSTPADAGKPHLLAATYYSVRPDLRATLMLNNKGPQPLDVQPTLYSLSGASLSVPAVTVPGTSFREIDLGEWIGGDDSFREGSLQVTYKGADLMLGAQVYLVDAAHSLAFEEKFAEPAAQFASARLEGVWWLPTHHCEARLVISNTTDAVLTVNARVDGRAPRQHEPA